MAEDDKEATSGQRSRRQRPTPTIDLTATEVANEAPPEAAPQAAAQLDPAVPESPVPESPAPGDAPQPEAAAEAKGGPAAEQAAPASPPRRIGGYVAAGAVGAVIAAIIAIALAASGYIPARSSDGALKSQLADLQARIQELASRKADSADAQAIDRLKQRIDRMEQAAGKPSSNAAADAAVLDRLTSAENTVKALGTSLTALSQRAGTAAQSATAAVQKADAAAKALQEFNDRQSAALDAIGKRLDALDRTAKATQDKVANESGADKAARFALACLALQESVTRGAPYAAELSAVKTLGGDDRALAALAPFAASGVPSGATMAAELRALRAKLAAAAGADTPRPVGFVARLEASAARLVRIRPVGEPAGDEPSAILARLDTRLARDDVDGAAAELRKLPDQARAVAAPWLKTFSERQAALAASRKLVADSAGALAAR